MKAIFFIISCAWTFTCFSQDLQQVTESGNTTTLPVVLLGSDVLGTVNRLQFGIGSYRLGEIGAERVVASGQLTDLYFSTGGSSGSSERMRILHNGKVGIGTSIPEKELDVNGGIKSRSLIVSEEPGIGMSNGLARLYVHRHFAGEDNTRVAEFRMADTGIDNSLTMLHKNTGGGQERIDFINAMANGDSIFKLTGLGNACLAGSLSIGTADDKGYKLAVAGNMIAESVRVKLQGDWPDFVFTEKYKRRTLSELERYIEENRHLPGIPPATKIQCDGIDLGSMNASLLCKIEELTLYLIEQDKKIKQQNRKLEDLANQEDKITKLEQRIQQLEGAVKCAGK